MDALEAIATRRMVPKVTGQRPTRAEVAELLDYAVRAPNHHLTGPWRFIVIAGGARDDLGEVMAESVRREYAGLPDLDHRVQLEKERPHRSPVIVTIVYVESSHPKAVEVEDRYAVGAALENLLLAAHAKGLGAYLRTGRAAYDPSVHRFLGLAEGEEVAGFVYLGYPAEEPGPLRRQSDPAERTTWLGWE